MNKQNHNTEYSVERPLITLDDIEEINDHPLIIFGKTR